MSRLFTLLLLTFCVPLAQAQLTAFGFDGSYALLNANGTWSVNVPGPHWTFSGTVGAAAVAPHIESGQDALGSYQAIVFNYTIADSSRTASIRMYQAKPVATFPITWNNESANTAPFPVISGYPSTLSHLTFFGEFAPPDFYDLMPDSPWAWFDAAGNTFILSPAMNFMTTTTQRRNDNSIATGISDQIATLPAGFTHTTALVFGRGINQTFETWGNALTTWGGKKKAPSDSEALLKSISYWTDNGGYYYYNAGGPSYTDTLMAIKKEFDDKGIKLGSLQLDSWWYPKGPDNSWSSHSGIWTYKASPALFQSGLTGFEAGLKTPLITHARWIDANSPYRAQYKMSGNVATDPAYWEDIATYLKTSGVATYEQDWLTEKAFTDFNLTDPDDFLGNMSAAMHKHGLTIQYCMASPTHFLQSTKYNNVTTIRTSQDGFRQENWTNFFYSGRFASALGMWPFTDVFMSSETNNLIIATLSAGPVGVGDKQGDLSKTNLLNAVRKDGVIVKPDVPATPMDSVFQKDALKIDTPMIATTYSDFGGGMKTYYLFAYVRGANRTVTVDPAAFGMGGDTYFYDWLHDTGQFIGRGSAYTFDLSDDTGFYVLAPVQASGIALLGDKDNFVGLGKKRIPKATDDGQVDVTVTFAAGEKGRTIFGYSPLPVDVTAVAGTYGGLMWDPSTQIFTVNVHPVKGTARIRVSQAGLRQPASPTKVADCAVGCDVGTQMLDPDR
jgi:hypothetical protein